MPIPTLRRVPSRPGILRVIQLACILTAAVATTAAVLPGAPSAAAGSAGRPLTAGVAAARQGALADPAGNAVLGMIAGTVRGSDGAALGGVCVTATGPNGTVRGKSGPAGRYIVGGLVPGSYAVGYSDCARPADYFEQWYGPADVPSAAARVQVSAGRPTPLRPVTLRRTSPAATLAAVGRTLRARPAGQASAADNSVTGTVRTRSGKPLRGICATAVRAFGGADIAINVATGARGGYRLPIGASGTWQVEFASGCSNSGNYAPQWWQFAATAAKATGLHARRGRSFHGINAALRPGAIIAGTVRAASGSTAGLRGVCVDAVGLGPASDVELQAVTRAGGSYVINSLGTGRYRVRFQPDCGQRGNFLAGRSRTVPVTDGRTTRGVNAALPSGGVISGTVTSRAAAAPLAGICVDIESAAADFDGSLVTGKRGTYSISRVPPGTYTVAFSGGCGSSGSYAPQSYDAMASTAGATPVRVTLSRVRSGIDAAMLPGGIVTGRVTSAAGSGLAGVCVLLTARDDASGLGQPEFERAFFGRFFGEAEPAGLAATDVEVTGTRGAFRAVDLPPGLYSAEFTGGCGHGSARFAQRAFAPQGTGGSDWVTVSPGIVTAGVSAVLRAGGTITGVITGQAGRRLSGICVHAVSRSGQAPAVAFPLGLAQSRRGIYSITGLAAGRYALVSASCGGEPYANQWYRDKATAAAATLVPVRAGKAAHANTALSSGGSISGQVRAAATGKAVANACVIVTDAAGNLVNIGVSGPEGRYQIAHVPAGRWNLSAYQCLAPSPPLAGVLTRGVRVRGGTASSADFKLPRGGRIAGTVRTGVPAAAAAGICVEATPATGDGQPGLAITGPGGRYALAGLARGTYRVLFTPLCAGGTTAAAAQWFDGKPARSAATLVAVRAGRATVAVNGTLTAEGGISGAVTGASRAAAAGVCVGAFAGSNPTPAAIAITRPDGSYQVSDLPPGRYAVEFSRGCGVARYATQWDDGAASRAGATPVVVTAGSVTPGIDAS
jgi:hypothetical protein